MKRVAKMLYIPSFVFNEFYLFLFNRQCLLCTNWVFFYGFQFLVGGRFRHIKAAPISLDRL